MGLTKKDTEMALNQNSMSTSSNVFRNLPPNEVEMDQESNNLIKGNTTLFEERSTFSNTLFSNITKQNHTATSFGIDLNRGINSNTDGSHIEINRGGVDISNSNVTSQIPDINATFEERIRRRLNLDRAHIE